MGVNARGCPRHGLTLAIGESEICGDPRCLLALAWAVKTRRYSTRMLWTELEARCLEEDFGQWLAEFILREGVARLTPATIHTGVVRYLAEQVRQEVPEGLREVVAMALGESLAAGPSGGWLRRPGVAPTQEGLVLARECAEEMVRLCGEEWCLHLADGLGVVDLARVHRMSVTQAKRKAAAWAALVREWALAR